MVAIANGAPQQSSEEGYSISFVPVGSKSGIRWEGEITDAIALASDPKALPPRFLSIRQGEKLVQRFSTLNRASDPVQILPGNLEIYASQHGGSDVSPELFNRVQIPQQPGHYDLFLTRHPQEEGWKKVLSFLVPGGRDAFPNSHVRVVNMSGFKAASKINNLVSEIEPKGVALVPLRGEAVTIQCAYLDQDEWRLVMRTRISQEDGARITVVFYPSRDPRAPLGAATYFQPETD